MNIKNLVFKYWYLIALILIVVLAFWLRSFPARFNELQALDPFYFFRLNEYALNNNFQLPNPDTFRLSPFGTNPYVEPFVPFYAPAIFYSLITFTGIHFLNFAILWPAFLGAIAVFLMFFLGKELFNYKTGLFAAFFLAVLPAFITRTSAGFLEKEPHAAVLIMLTMYLFIKSYKRSSWKYGIFSGIAMFLLLETWGGAQFFIILIASFVMILLLINKYSDSLLKSFAPVAIIGIGFTQFFGYKIGFFNLAGMVPLSILILLLIRFFVERKNLIKEEYIPYLVPGLLVFGLIAFVIASFFSDFLNTVLNSVISAATLTPGVELSTVAESQPGSFAIINSLTDAHFASVLLTQLNSLTFLLSVLLFSVLGLLVVLYKLVRRREVIMIIPIIWFLGSIHGVLGFIRLSFLIGPAFALMAGYFFATLINKTLSLGKIKNAINIRQKINYISIILIAIIVLTVSINTANGFVYSTRLGPSICFPRNNQPCITFDSSGNFVFDQGQPWYQAMNFLSTQTPEDANILSWWDFGYWFQTRGLRATVSDGGGSYRYDIALWYTAPVEEWSNFTWLEERRVSHILMDFTLPGKYGAISTIATQAKNPVGILSFQPAGTLQQDNTTVLQFSNGPYRIWLPQNNGELSGSPMFLQQQGGVYSQPQFINDVCTTNGIVATGNRTPSIGGCLSLSNTGVYYIPPQAENTIFSSLMFMDGADLPVQKVFDNQLIKIYEVLY